VRLYDTLYSNLIKLIIIKLISDGPALEGGADHGVCDEAGGREHAAAKAERMLPPQVPFPFPGSCFRFRIPFPVSGSISGSISGSGFRFRIPFPVPFPVTDSASGRVPDRRNLVLLEHEEVFPCQAGLPDFSWCNIPNTERIPNDHKI
jgi:hypothetical protein